MFFQLQASLPLHHPLPAPEPVRYDPLEGDERSIAFVGIGSGLLSVITCDSH